MGGGGGRRKRWETFGGSREDTLKIRVLLSQGTLGPSINRRVILPGSSRMQGASPATEHRVPVVEIVEEQQSLPVSPGTLPQPGPPQRPQATSQQTKFTVSSKPEKPLLQVLFEVTSSLGQVPTKEG